MLPVGSSSGFVGFIPTLSVFGPYAASFSHVINDGGAIVGTTTKISGGTSHGVMLLPINIRFATPGDSTWSDLAEKQVILFGDNTLVHVTISLRFTSLAQMTTIPELSKIHLSTNITLAAGVDVPLTSSNCVLTPGTDPNTGLANTDLKITLTRTQLQSLGLLPQDSDGIDEKTWFDWGSSDPTSDHNLTDSHAFDVGSPAVSLGQCSNYGHLSDTTPNSPVDKTFLEAAGREVITASIGGDPSPPRAIAHQADTFYISAEGLIHTGVLNTDYHQSDNQTFAASDAQWQHSLKTVIIFASFSPDAIRAVESDLFPAYIFYFNPGQRETSNALFELLERKNQPILSLRTLFGGYLDPVRIQVLREKTPPHWAIERFQALSPIYEKSGCASWSEFSFSFLRSFPTVLTTISGTSKLAHLDELLAADSKAKPLDPKLVDEIKNLHNK